MSDPWFLLYDGDSPDGRGSASYIGRTTDVNKAFRHYKKCKNNPYSTGRVMIITDSEVEYSSVWTSWDKLPEPPKDKQ